MSRFYAFLKWSMNYRRSFIRGRASRFPPLLVHSRLTYNIAVTCRFIHQRPQAPSLPVFKTGEKRVAFHPRSCSSRCLPLSNESFPRGVLIYWPTPLSRALKRDHTECERHLYELPRHSRLRNSPRIFLLLASPLFLWPSLPFRPARLLVHADNRDILLLCVWIFLCHHKYLVWQTLRQRDIVVTITTSSESVTMPRRHMRVAWSYSNMFGVVVDCCPRRGYTLFEYLENPLENRCVCCYHRMCRSRR